MPADLLVPADGVVPMTDEVKVVVAPVLGAVVGVAVLVAPVAVVVAGMVLAAGSLLTGEWLSVIM